MVHGTYPGVRPAATGADWRNIMVSEYHGALYPWVRQIKRWRKQGLSWTSIGRLLEALGVEMTRKEKQWAIYNLGCRAQQVHKQITKK